MNTRHKDKEPPAPAQEGDEKKAGTEVATGNEGRVDNGTGTEVQVYEFGDDAGKGMENIRREERKIGFLTILDPKSPQCKPVSAGGVPGAKGGALYVTSTGRVYDGEKGVDFVPVYRDENYPEFIPREPDGSGGGFVGIRAADDELVLKLRAEQGKFGKLKTTNNTELTQTYYLYGLLIDPEDGTPFPVLTAYKSTQIKKYQGFIDRNDAIQYPGKEGAMVKPPIWAHVWHLSTRYEEKGTFSWFGWVIRLREEPSRLSLLRMTDPLYITAKNLFTAITSSSDDQKKKAYSAAAEQGRQHEADEEVPM